MSKFLDLSDWNTVLDYTGIKEQYEGAIVKATQGKGFIANSFHEKVQALKTQGLKVGAYHFLDMSGSPEEQAQHFWDTVKEYEFELSYVLDIEDEGGDFDGNPSLHIEAFINYFNVISGGKKIIVYTGWYYCRDKVIIETRQKYKWWIASYGVQNLNQIEGADIVAWQYTNSEQVSGIASGVDASVILNDGIYNTNYTVTQPQPTQTNQLTDEPILDEYSETGTATVIIDVLNVRDKPSTNIGQVLTAYNNGEKFNYDYVIITQSYVWVRYLSYTGKIRYVAVKNRTTGERYADCV